MKIALYARVSKNDKSQDPQNQIVPLRNYAKALEGKIVEEYVDLASGSGAVDRVNFLRMFEDADKHKFDLLLISGSNNGASFTNHSFFDFTFKVSIHCTLGFYT